MPIAHVSVPAIHNNSFGGGFVIRDDTASVAVGTVIMMSPIKFWFFILSALQGCASPAGI